MGGSAAQLGKRSQLAAVLQLFLLGSVFCRKIVYYNVFT